MTENQSEERDYNEDVICPECGQLLERGADALWRCENGHDWLYYELAEWPEESIRLREKRKAAR